ncbi:ATP synthase F0 subcomplex C subunit [Cohaesibacter sp. ES.047]|uniref:F0F1 ATP synthase subunit C n=1 Tax=Cohaesibacter sp. ES.047 TaxID=1798205 RepID=UPI000BB87EEE|nr:F0F1 ATP synthase subunit C [Cohaesibacter sp. ES.047]SNY92546.1 ATP synthase F0 subcomplex C subunit [Cohaesibacter sp. ES.047]
MEAEAAKLIGAGIACVGMGGAGIGVGTIFGNYLSGALRNPSAAPAQFTNALIGAALAEGLGIFSLVIALVLIFVA